MGMRQEAFGVFVVGSALILAACSSQPDNSREVAAGQRLHEETAGGVGCASCHGMNARGEGLAPDIRGVTADQIIDSLKNTEDMREIALTKADINDIVAFLAMLKEKALKAQQAVAAQQD
ncbi:MAG: cytochrome c [Alphaproteobacteria bacterium]|nr:cytochrome c [Alphaproteobacteria bacterium]